MAQTFSVNVGGRREEKFIRKKGQNPDMWSILKTAWLIEIVPGLVQGDPLSCSLCDLYFGFVTQEEMLKPFEQTVKREKAKRIFVRGMDDFLFASTDIMEAEW